MSARGGPRPSLMCGCEHERHLGAEPEGHAYLDPAIDGPDVIAYASPLGGWIALCGWCWDVCHGAEYERLDEGDAR